MKIHAYVSDLGSASAIAAAGGIVQRTIPKTLLPIADQELGLNGALLAMHKNEPLDFKNIPSKSDEEWTEFLDREFGVGAWERWFGTTNTANYSIVLLKETCSNQTLDGTPPSESKLEAHLPMAQSLELMELGEWEKAAKNLMTITDKNATHPEDLPFALEKIADRLRSISDHNDPVVIVELKSIVSSVASWEKLSAVGGAAPDYLKWIMMAMMNAEGANLKPEKEIRANRRKSSRCELCGNALGKISLFLKRESHTSCKEFSRIVGIDWHGNGRRDLED